MIAFTWVLRLKSHGLTRIIINAIAGGILINGLSALGIISLPFNAFNVAVIAVLGFPGAIVVIALAFLL